MAFETVRSEHDQITVATNIDVTTVGVDFEKLKAVAGLASAEEAAEIWESIKHVVSSASAATVAQRSEIALEAPEKIPPWNPNASRPSLVQQLYTAARDIQLFAYKAQLKDLEARIERSEETSPANVARSEPRNRYTEGRLQVAKDDVSRALSMHGVRNNTRALTAWFIQGLFGDRGLDNFYSSQQEYLKRRLAKEHTAPQRDLPLTPMDKVLVSYQRIRDCAGLPYGQAYQDRLRLYVCFFDQLTSLRNRFWQRGSAEQRALLAYAEDKHLSAPSERTESLKPRPSMQQVAWVWLTERTGQSRSVIDDAIWKGRQIRTMIDLFGDGVLYFMNSYLEIE